MNCGRLGLEYLLFFSNKDQTVIARRYPDFHLAPMQYGRRVWRTAQFPDVFRASHTAPRDPAPDEDTSEVTGFMENPRTIVYVG